MNLSNEWGSQWAARIAAIAYVAFVIWGVTR